MASPALSTYQRNGVTVMDMMTPSDPSGLELGRGGEQRIELVQRLVPAGVVHLAHLFGEGALAQFEPGAVALGNEFQAQRELGAVLHAWETHGEFVADEKLIFDDLDERGRDRGLPLGVVVVDHRHVPAVSYTHL